MLALLILIALGLGLGFGSYRLARRRPRLGSALLPLLLASLAARAVLSRFPAAEWALCPWPWYAAVQGFTLYPLAVVFFGLAAARLPVRWNRHVVFAVGLAVLGHGLWRHRHLAWPEVHGAAVVPGPDHHLRQSTIYTCGPAACASALAHCGRQHSEADLAALCLTRRGGTSLFDLYRGLVLATAGSDLQVSIEALRADELLAAPHVVVASDHGGGHAFCFVTGGDGVLVHDPLLRTPQAWSAAEFTSRYQGPAIVLRGQTPAASPR